MTLPRWPNRTHARGRLVADILAAATQGRGADAIAPQDVADIVPLLLRSGAGPLAWWALRASAAAGSPGAAELVGAYRADAMRAAIANVELEELSREISAAGLDVVLGKGWSVARAYPSLGLRPYSDFDFYLRRRDHSRFLAVLAARSPGRIFAVDVHPGMSYLDDRDADIVFARSRLALVGSAGVRVFGPEDHLRLVCLHALAEGVIRPTWLCDVAVLAAAVPPDFDWDYFGAGSPRGDWCRAAVALAHEVLGLDVSHVPASARCRSLPRWLARSVLSTWGQGPRPKGSRTPMDQIARKPGPMLRALVERWPLPIEATVGVGGRIDGAPRLPYEIAEALRRGAAYLHRRRPEGVSAGRGTARRHGLPVPHAPRPSAGASPAVARRSHPASGPRVAILVVGCLLPEYSRCIRAIRSTWGATSTDAVDIYYVYGTQRVNPAPGVMGIEELIGRPGPSLREHEAWVSGDVILCGAADLLAEQRDCVLRKRLIAFGYLANDGHYDFVYTVCACSYVDVGVLRGYVNELPASGVYQGPLGIHAASGAPFVSGASMLLSRDLAADLSRHAGAIIAANDGVEPDDVAIGRWIAEHHSHEPVRDICRRIAAGERATSGQTFVIPYGRGLTDYVLSPPVDQIPRPQTYHYHFHAQRIWQLEAFHRRHFSADVREHEKAHA